MDGIKRETGAEMPGLRNESPEMEGLAEVARPQVASAARISPDESSPTGNISRGKKKDGILMRVKGRFLLQSQRV